MDEQSKKWALLIEKVPVQPQGFSYKIEAQNTGISDFEVVMLVEAWLEKVKEDIKAPIKDNFRKGPNMQRK